MGKVVELETNFVGAVTLASSVVGGVDFAKVSEKLAENAGSCVVQWLPSLDVLRLSCV